MLGNGKHVDLYKLFMMVKEKGGYDTVCKNRLWDLVGEEYGLGISFGSKVKLVYMKYLRALETWLKNVADSKFPECGLVDSRFNFSKRLMEFQAELFSDDYAKEEVVEELGNEDDYYPCKRKLCGTNRVKGMNPESNVATKVLNGILLDLNMPLPEHMVNEPSMGNLCTNNDAMEMVEEYNGGKMSAKQIVDLSDVENSIAGLSGGGTRCDYDDDVLILDPSSVDEESFGHKRKRESMWEILSWVTGIAKNPCDPEVGSMPEKSKWKSYSCEEIWKQALLFRDAVFLKRDFESSSEQLSWQGQRMHPCLYDDQLGAIYNLRERLKCDKRLLLGQSTSAIRVSSDSFVGTWGDLEKTQSPHTEDYAEKQLLDHLTAHSSLDRCGTAQTALGPGHQAEVPEWNGMISDSDSKWLGNLIWSSEKVNNILFIERDPIGKGREDSCPCQVPGSVECVRLHIAEKRLKVMLELGGAFYQWHLHNVGEEVGRFWTVEEQKKFEDLVRSNPSSPERYFWDHIFASFPKKSREDLVSYYFNVFLVQRRGYQNRHTPDNIDSDDDGSEFGPLRNVFGYQTQKSRGFTLLSPKKP